MRTFLTVLILLLSPSVFAAHDPMAPEFIRARTAPVGQVDVATATTTTSSTTAATSNNTGQKIYETRCALCHLTGLAGAPKFGDKAAWQPHIAKGMTVLFQHVHDGFNAMPAKGACMECSDADLKAAIDYMTGHSK